MTEDQEIRDRALVLAITATGPGWLEHAGVVRLAERFEEYLAGPRDNPGPQEPEPRLLKPMASLAAESDVHIRRINDGEWGVALRIDSQLHWLTRFGIWGSESEPLSFVDDGSR